MNIGTPDKNGEQKTPDKKEEQKTPDPSILVEDEEDGFDETPVASVPRSASSRAGSSFLSGSAGRRRFGNFGGTPHPTRTPVMSRRQAANAAKVASAAAAVSAAEKPAVSGTVGPKGPVEKEVDDQQPPLKRMRKGASGKSGRK